MAKPRRRKCKNAECRQWFNPVRANQIVCSPKCSYKYSNQLADKAWKKEKKELKESLKTLQEHLKECQVLFNRWIRLTKEPTCISSGIDLRGRKYDAGHYRSVGNCPALRFEPDNVWPQSVHDNQYLSGNLIEYRKRLVKKLGLERVEWLEQEHPPKKYTIPEVVLMKQELKEKIRKLNG